jgi:hypothetical protein
MFVVQATDVNGDDLYYLVDWGDNTTSGWLGPYASGAEVTATHSWSQQGTYTVKVKAKDIPGDESDWGTLEIVMPFDYQINHYSFNQFFLPLTERLNT